MQILLNDQLTAIEKLRQFKVGALFMEPGTGKTRAAYELVRSVHECDYILWLTPFQTKVNLLTELRQCDSGINFLWQKLEIIGIETISSSDRTYLRLMDSLSKASCPFIIVDESLKIKNWDAIRTKRIIELGKIAQYKLVLNGTPISRNLLDIWAQMEFLSPKILGMCLAEFENTFCEYIKVTKRIGYRSWIRKFIKKYHNVDYLYSLIGHYVYECDLQLEIGKQYLDLDYRIDGETLEQYQYLKEHYLDNEKLMAMNNNIFLELTQKMQHLYCTVDDKFTQVSQIIRDVAKEKVLIYCKFIASRQECEKRFPGVRIMSYGMHSFGLNLQDYNMIIFFDKTFDYAQRLQAERRIFRTGQKETCYYYDLTGDVGLEKLINDNISKKTDLLDYFKRVGIKVMEEL
jgi:SNF2 family DNA or RNA helicase